MDRRQREAPDDLSETCVPARRNITFFFFAKRQNRADIRDKSASKHSRVGTTALKSKLPRVWRAATTTFLAKWCHQPPYRPSWKYRPPRPWTSCEGCDIVQSDHAPQAGVAQGIFNGDLIRRRDGHQVELEEELEEEVERRVRRDHSRDKTQVRMHG